MTRTLSIVAVAGLVAVALSGVAVAATHGSDGDKLTICHVPPGNPEAARTMEVSRSSWSAHEGHGDHEGACTAADARRPATPPPAPREVPKTPLALSIEGDGEVDGDASFQVVAANQGSAPGRDVKLVATLHGDGDWRLRSVHGIGCSVEGRTVTCASTDILADGQASLRLAFEGQPSVCREVSVEVRMTATNDSSVGDDRSRSSVWVGACSPLDRDP